MEQVVSPTTTIRYRAAVTAFYNYLRSRALLISDLDDIDVILAEYIQHLFSSGAPRQSAINAVFGLINIVPALKHRLILSRRSLTAWTKLIPSVPFPPMTWELACAMAVTMIRRSSSIHLGIAVLLAHDCLLRLSELCGLHVSDIAFPDDPRVGESFAGVTLLRLRVTKTGSNKWVTVRRPCLVFFLILITQHRLSADKVFPFSSSSFRASFNQAVADLRLASSYVPHSLRHGGATELYLRGWPLLDIMQRGRWANSKSAQHYIQAGPALLLAQQSPPFAASLGSLVGSNVILSLLCAAQIS